jgi:hypothetical protein
MAQYIPHGFGQIRPARHARQAVLQPEMQILDQRSTSFLTDGPTYLQWLAADSGLDGVEFGDTCQHLGRER